MKLATSAVKEDMEDHPKDAVGADDDDDDDDVDVDLVKDE